MAVAAEQIEAHFLGQSVSSAEREEILQQLNDPESLAAIIARRFSRAARRFADPDGPLIGALPPSLDISFDQLPDLNRQAVDLMRTGRWEDAYPIRLNTCRLALRYLGEEHRDTATYLNSLGRILYEQGEFGRAERVYERAIDLRSKHLGERHSETAISWTGLGRVLEATGEYDDALECHQFALEVTEEQYGPRHPETAVSLHDVGCVSLSLLDVDAAMQSFERAAEIAREIDGENTPVYASALVHLAAAREAAGQKEAAEALCLRALQILEQAHGSDHADVAWCLDHVAGLRLSQGNSTGARPYVERAVGIEIGEGRWGQLLHASIMGNLAVMQHMEGERRNAAKSYRAAISLYEHWLLPDHPAVALLRGNLALMTQLKVQRRRTASPIAAQPVYFPINGQAIVLMRLELAA